MLQGAAPYGSTPPISSAGKSMLKNGQQDDRNRDQSSSMTSIEQDGFSMIPCTQECTYCFIDWSQKRLTVKSGNVGYSYPFSKCSIRSMWDERTLARPDITHRRAVLVLQGFSEWRYTLAPECHHEEPALSRLAAELHFTAPRTIRTAPVVGEGAGEESYRKLTEEEMKALEERYSSSAVVQRANLGPLTSQFLRQCLDEGGRNDEGDASVRRSQLIREKDESWQEVEMGKAILKNGSPWIKEKDVSGFVQESNGYSGLQAVKNGLCCSPVKDRQKDQKRKPKLVNPWDEEQESIERVRRLQNEGTAKLESSVVKPLTELTSCLMDFIGDVWERCQQPELKQKFANSPDLIFSEEVLWSEEPILPVQFYFIRHGQQLMMDGRGCGVELNCPLSQLGRIQSVRTAELLHQWTNGFKGARTLAVLSSELQRSKETANILWHSIESLGGKDAIDRCLRRSHLQLGEYIPSYQYRVNNGDDEEKVKEELDRDIKSQDESYWILSAALRGLKGPLIPPQGRDEYRPIDLCGDEIKLLGLPPPVVQRYRFPSLSMKSPSNILGVLLGPSSVTKSPMENGQSVNVIYSGHGNTIKNFMIREIGLPKHLWKYLQLPHCSTLLMGLHHTGRPSLIIADAGYLSLPLKGDPLPISFTPLIRSEELPTKELSHKNKLATDQMITLLAPDDEGSEVWAGVGGRSSVTYERPMEPSSKEKHVLLLRAGHNAVVNCRDAGLTEIGVQQLEAAAEWLCLFFKSGRVVDCPTSWCTAGLTSDWTSIDLTLKESLVIIKEKFKETLGADSHDLSLLPNQEALYPENLFAAPSVDGCLNVIVADDYHLLKYFGACFGIDPLHLQHAYWPHAAHILVTITAEGFPELRTFGTISHLHPNMISILPTPTDQKPKTKREASQRPTGISTKPQDRPKPFLQRDASVISSESLESPLSSPSPLQTPVKVEPVIKKPSLPKMFTPSPKRPEMIPKETTPTRMFPKIPPAKSPVAPQRPIAPKMPSPKMVVLEPVAVTPKAPEPKAPEPKAPEPKVPETEPSPSRSPELKMVPAIPIAAKVADISSSEETSEELETMRKASSQEPYEGRTKAISPYGGIQPRKLSADASEGSSSFEHPTFGETPRSDASSEELHAVSRYGHHGELPKSVPPSIDEESILTEERTEYFTPATDHQRRDALLGQLNESSASFASFTPENRQSETIEKPEGQGIVRLISFEPPLSSATSEDSLDRRMELAFAEQDKTDDEADPFKLKE